MESDDSRRTLFNSEQRHVGPPLTRYTDGSISLSPYNSHELVIYSHSHKKKKGSSHTLYANLTIDLHVRTAASLHQSFLWLHPIHA
jgi:hypothetical protein